MKLGLKKLRISILFTIILLLILQGLALGQEAGRAKFDTTISIPNLKAGQKAVPANVLDPDSRYYFKTDSNVFVPIKGDTSDIYFYSHVYLCVEKCNITTGASGASLTIKLKIYNRTKYTLQNVILKLRKADIEICCGTTSFSLTSPTEAVVHYGNIAAGACGSSTEEFSFAVSNLVGSEPVCLLFTVYYYPGGNYFDICHNTVISASQSTFTRLIGPAFITAGTAALGWLLYDKFKK